MKTNSALHPNDLFGERDMVNIAIERLKLFEPIALNMNPAGYWIGISGGKDSSVIYHLAKTAKVKATFHHSLTTVDAPETIWHIKKEYPDVKIHRRTIPLLQKIKQIRTTPPSRNGRRWCCRDYKEHFGTGYMVVTGVRAAESARRSGYRVIEQCMRAKTKRFCHVIIDWTDEMVWEYINENNIPINPLYKEPFNFKRVGCVLCPLALPGVEEQSRRWHPRIVAAWEKAIKEWFKRFGDECCDINGINTAEEYWQWWLTGQAGSLPDKNQETLIFEEPKESLRQCPI
jgi:3'-phosphoadenosine 5'-phosphosulfate sulfotransferase (PAPS reductase)/FAD synthetase